MKTIEERAKEAGIVSQYKSDYRYDARSVESGYMQGATEQKVIDIDKACQWLCECCPAQLDEENDLSGCVGNENSSCPTLESLINAMEE